MRTVFLVIAALLLLVAPTHAANNITDNPLILDTAGSGLVVTGDVRVSCVKWVGATTTGHQAVLQDNNSRIVWEDLAPGTNFTVSECLPLTFHGGLKLTTLGSGKVYIYVAP